MKNTISLIRTSIERSFFRCSSLPVLLACFALGELAQAVVPPADGGYPGGNTAEGQNALFSLTTGTYNTAVGLFSLRSNTEGNFNTGVGAGTLLINTGEENTATGTGALLSNTAGGSNTANGAFALFSNTTGPGNTAIGVQALFSNTEGDQNTATGFKALLNNTTGDVNTANGSSALLDNTTGSLNTAKGASALRNNTTGSFNTATGFAALAANTTGENNTAAGYRALLDNTGDSNTANGVQALRSNTTGGLNTANGFSALFSNSTGGSNTADGDLALYNNTTGTGNVALGSAAGFNATTGNNNVYLGQGMQGVADESNACYIASIFGQTSVNGVPVLINSDNKLGTTTSSKRFKEDIKPMDTASEAILALKPVTFRYKKAIDPTGTVQFGLVAEEVEKVNPDLVVRDKEGKTYSVRYDQVNAMLLNEFLKEHRKVQEKDCKIEKQEATIAQLTQEIETVVAHAKEQDSKIQRVSAQIELSKPVAQPVVLKMP